MGVCLFTGTLVRRKGSDEVDSAPLAVGLTTLLRQLHPSVLKSFLQYCSQYVRTCVAECFASSKPKPLAPNAINVLLFIRQMVAVAEVPRRVIDAIIPEYIFDSIDVSA